MFNSGNGIMLSIFIFISLMSPRSIDIFTYFHLSSWHSGQLGPLSFCFAESKISMSDQGRLPVGLRFRPTQQELICLLQVKARGLNVSAFAVPVLEKNLYGKEEDMEPWKVLCDVDNDKWQFYDDSGKKDSKRVLYVFSKLSKMSAKKIGRRAGCGTWDGQTKQDVYQGDKIVGLMKLFSYVVDPVYESAVANKGYWYMHEYSLSEHSLNEIGIGSTDYVLCRVIRDDSKSCGLKASNGKNVKTNCEGGFGDDVEHNVGNHVKEEINTNYYYDATTLAPSMMDWSIHNQEMASFGAQNNVQQTNNEILYYDQCAGEYPHYYNPTIYAAPIEDKKCSHQQVLGSDKYCLGVKDEKVIVIDEEKKVPQGDESMVKSGSKNAAAADDLTELYQYRSSEFLKLLDEDDPGLDQMFSDNELENAEEAWKSYLADP